MAIRLCFPNPSSKSCGLSMRPSGLSLDSEALVVRQCIRFRRRRGRILSHDGQHIDGDVEVGFAAAEDDAFDGAKVMKIAAPTDGDMPVAGATAVGGIEVEP